jgi:hypothetical protein
MTEVRPVNVGSGGAAGAGAGLFVTRDYRVGEEILVESDPLLDLSSLTPEQDANLRSNFNLGEASEASITFRDAIVVPKDVPAHERGKFRSMAQVGAWFLVFRPPPEKEAMLLDLYSPSLEEPTGPDEAMIINLAKRALRYLKATNRDGSLARELLNDTPTEEKLLKAMLVWACNAFEGGRVYALQSRINHSCLPNAVVVVDPSGNASSESVQSTRASSPISAGDQVCVSYLGTLLYADTPRRQDELRSSKYFTCRCPRCTDRPDTAASIPCVTCHPRITHRGRQLDEDTQYDDDQLVRYMVPSRDHEGNISSEKWVWKCASCGSSAAEDSSEHGLALVASRSISRSVAAYLREQQKVPGGGPVAASSSGRLSVASAAVTSDDADDGSELLEEHLTLASSVVGARHWTTNVLLLLQLDRLLQGYHARLLRSEVNPKEEEEEDDAMETIASGIDMLQRVCRFVDGLELPMHRGHLLSHVILGAVRALASLGDAKSLRYAGEWLAKLDGYVESFESEGIQKVVVALKRRAQNPGLDGDERQNKKLKSSK